MFVFLLKKIPTVIFCLLCCIFFLMTELVFHTNIIRVPFEFAVAKTFPAQHFFTQVVFFPKVAIERSIQEEKQLTALQMEKSFLESQVAQLQYLQSENQQLKDELSLQGQYQATFPRYQLVAKTISSSKPWSIDKGQQDGVNEFDLVLFQGVLVGAVHQVLPYFSTLNMIHHGELSVIAETTSGDQGVVRLENGSVVLTHLRPDAKITEGDKIYSAGAADRLMPKGLYLGSVKSIQKQPADDSLTAIIDQGIDIHLMKSVIIQGFRN